MARVFSKKIKIVLSMVLISQLFGMTATPVYAGLFSKAKIPTASSMLSDVEQRYHLDPGSIQTQGESLNTASAKKPVPAVSLFFTPSDPRIGEKITAKAFPVYFANVEKDLYYTWYLKRKGCDVGSPATPTCDVDKDGSVTEEDWKVAAALLVVQNGYDAVEAGANYSSDTDNDGFEAPMGGGNKKDVNAYCYYTDPETGENYELGTSGDINFSCPPGKVETCLIGEGEMNPVDISIPGDGGSDPMNPIPPTAGTTGPAFEFLDTGVCSVSGTPRCRGGVPYCISGSPRCVDDVYANPLVCNDLGTTPLIAGCTSGGGFSPSCEHLFPRVAFSGDGTFAGAEEEFWQTNPKDPSTASNGSKDEANVVGLGQSSFTWNYLSGDQVGVVVEGTSMIPTKYEDSSSMIMWAFAKGDCPSRLATSKGAFYKNVKGFSVEILSMEFDLNKCLERNLVDPTEGGQSSNIELSVSATPETPINDASFVISGGLKVAEGNGDTVRAEASVSNASRSASEMFFEWSVEMANNPQFTGGSGDVTSQFQALKLLGNTKGIALDAVNLKLDILDDPTMLFAGRQLGSYLDPNGIGYLRFRVKASENFASGVVRKGKSDVVVRFMSTDKKIAVYKPETIPVGSSMQVRLPDLANPATKPICDDDPLDRVSCRIIKNEVIGLYINPTDLTNFQWSINGAPLRCNREFVSPDCAAGEQNFVNFFPVTGNVGDTYTVTVSANDVSTGKTVNLARSFHVIKPELLLQSADLGTAWPKLVGQYKDVDGASSVACPGGFCNQYSDSVLEGFSTETLKIQSDFIPDFLGAQAKRQWTIDGTLFPDVASAGPPAVYTISFVALKEAPDVYNIALSASVQQSQEMRRALRDIWNVSPLESTEILFNTTAQIQLKEPGYAQGTLQGTKKYLAALSSYVPTSVMFSFRVLLSVLLILFTTRFLLALLPEQPNFSTVPRRRG